MIKIQKRVIMQDVFGIFFLVTPYRMTYTNRQGIDCTGADTVLRAVADNLSHDSRVYAIVREELVALKVKFGDERRTEIQTVSGETSAGSTNPLRVYNACSG